jgi:hypothetical protein
VLRINHADAMAVVSRHVVAGESRHPSQGS